MSWMENLCKSYDSTINAKFSESETPLIPVGFTQKAIKFYVTLDRNGEVQSVDSKDIKNDKKLETIPSTPQAESRTGKVGAPFPLAEQLKYFIPTDEKVSCYQKYMEQLSEWCQEPDAPECLSILKSYLERGTLLDDISARVSEKELKDEKAFVTFSVYGESDTAESALWKRSDVIESWSRRIASKASADHELCYVRGQILAPIESHPKVQGNAKLISAKDAAYPFLYKGRFVEDRSSAVISYDASIRAHNTLDWLVKRQGFNKYGMIFVAWNTNGCPMEVPVIDNPLLLRFQQAPKPPDTYQEYSKELANACLGLSKKFLEHSEKKRSNEVSILGMEASTKGRMSITYYQEIPGNDYVERLKHWYANCCWGKLRFEDVVEDGKQKKVPKRQIFTPNPRQIAEAVIGVDTVQTARGDLKCEKSATKLMRETNLRLMSCIAGEAPLPHDMVVSAFHHAVLPLSFTDKTGSWSDKNWMRTIATACALIHKEQTQPHEIWEREKAEAEKNHLPFNKPEPVVFDADLDTASHDRDYLYGRLLAAAHYAECAASGDYHSQTNTVRLFQRFVQRPAETWCQLHDKLLPYLSRLSQNAKQEWTQNRIRDIECLFDADGLSNTAPLGLHFLQGFHSQYLALSLKKVSLCAGAELPIPQRRSEKFGVLLAVADYVELKSGEGKDDKDRTGFDHAGATTAQRMMPIYAARPVETWEYIHSRLIPYLEQLEKKSAGENEEFQEERELTYSPHLERKYAKLLRWAESLFTESERADGSRLDRSYLNSYYRMKKALFCGCTAPKEIFCTESDLSREMVYGRLLGLENRIERYVMDTVQKTAASQYRPSNAVRLMPGFAMRPAESWNKLRGKLEAYRKHLPSKLTPWLTELEKLEAMAAEHNWNDNTPLNGNYLTYYYRTDLKKEN